jgi:hypothetical protein
MRSRKGGSVRLSIGYFNLSERNEIARELIPTMEFSAGFCGYFYDLLNNSISFDSKEEVNIPRRSK